ncbi:MAG TPA: SGNH/GDSL hydrolase family protein, partial [Gemmatimonadaceae bacterium]|nr:SGNH/GDSL hydrolase family protein [Gemmatimonadaceae bacterium]
MAEASGPQKLSGIKVAMFTAIAMLLPFAVIGLLEIALRAGGYGRAQALFIPATFDSARFLMPNPRFAARYFPGDPSPPTPPSDAFLREKPPTAFRVFVLGESTTAGFPFASNGTFSRVLADALGDVLSVPVEVVNVGIPATNSFALYDQLPDVIAQRPDAVLIYAGHNEYYGALGAASTVRLAGNPGLVRTVLRLKRLRVVMLFQRAVDAARPRSNAPPSGVSRMEELAGRDTLRLGGDGYRRGVEQLRGNLRAILRDLHDAGIPAYVASLASNLRDQAPFASDSGTAATNAGAAFAAAHVALAAGDPAAESLFARARDLDLVRFRAPGEFNTVIRDVAAAESATYVPVAEAFRLAAESRIPGDDLFFEHVHPRPAGIVLIARAFFDALRARRFHGRLPDVSLIEDWNPYAERMALTAVDSQVASTIVAALKSRWPFVRRDSGL